MSYGSRAIINVRVKSSSGLDHIGPISLELIGCSYVQFEWGNSSSWAQCNLWQSE